MTTDDEDVAEKLPKTTQNSQQTAENVNGDQNELFGAPLAIRRRRVRGSRSNSSSRTKKKMSKGIDIEQMEMGRATLIASLLLLAGICAIHLLLVAENPNEFIAKNTNGIVAHFGRPLPRSIDHQIYPKFKNRADKFVQNQLEKLASDLEQLHTNLDELTSRLPFRVNMLLTEQRRRNTVQRPRSATPIPANLPMTANRPTRHSARHPNSMSNSENWSPPPPQQMAEASTSEDQNQFGEIGEEPTLMDYDAIDAYWRWDIEQEKGPASVLMQQPYQYPYPYNHFQQFVEPQQQQQWTPPNAQQNDESAEMFLYERDIQLLTEKTQFPELSIFGETVNDDANLPTNALEEDEYLLADISQTKWEMPPQWPTTSSEEESAQFGLENNGNGGDDHGILWTTQRLGKLLPFQAGIGPELLNIPVVTPPPTAVDFEDPQQNVPPIGAEEEAPISSNSCEQFSPTQISFIPSPQTTSAEHPILFNDVSLAEATIINSADGQIDTSNSEFGGDIFVINNHK